MDGGDRGDGRDGGEWIGREDGRSEDEALVGIYCRYIRIFKMFIYVCLYLIFHSDRLLRFRSVHL